MELIKSFCYIERRHYHAPCPHFTVGWSFPTIIDSSLGDAGPWCQDQPPCIANQHLDPVQLFMHSSRVWLTDKTDGHSCSSLELESVGLRSVSFFSPKSCWIFQSWLEGVDRVKLSASMTSCDKWFQFCSTRWLKKIPLLRSAAESWFN